MIEELVEKNNKLSIKVEALTKLLSYHNLSHLYIEDQSESGYFVIIKSVKQTNMVTNFISEDIKVDDLSYHVNTDKLTTLKENMRTLLKSIGDTISSIILDSKVEVDLLDALEGKVKDNTKDISKIIQTFVILVLPLLVDLRDMRTQLSYSISETDYIEFLESQLSHIRSSLKDLSYLIKEREETNKYDYGYFVIPLSAYEQRLLRVNEESLDYINCEENYQELLIRQRNMVRKQTSSFLFPTISKDLLFLEMDDILNILRFDNLIYIPLSSNKKGMEYSFFTLEKIVDNVKYWRIDPHLEDIISILSAKLIDFACGLMRDFITDWCGDLIYRTSTYFDWSLSKPKKILPSRWNQYFRVWKNLFILSDSFFLGEILRKRIINSSKYYMGINDRIAAVDDSPALDKQYSLYLSRVKIGKAPEEQISLDFLEDIFTNLEEWNYTKSSRAYNSKYKKRQ